jgi:hypothetical protein
MKLLSALALAGFTCVAAAPAAYADVRLSIGNGRVSLVAKDATLRQILTEWARIGQTNIVNVDRIPGGPVTLELDNMPEDQALDLLLRSLSGYLAAPRPTMIANTSRFDRIVIMPTIAPPKAAVAAVTPTINAAPPTQAPDDEIDDDKPAPNVVMPAPNQRGPVFTPFPQPRVVNPQQQPQQQQQPMTVPGQYPAQQQAEPGSDQQGAPNTPTMPPGTVSAPGMIAPAPTTPAPGQPGAPVRRPGGGGPRDR